VVQAMSKSGITRAMESVPAQGTDSLETMVRVDGVRHRFGASGEGLLALDRIDMQIKAGEMVSFIGPSGCGKSTLLNVIGGMLKPSEGEASVAGMPVRGPMPKTMAYVFQENALLPWATVLDNIKVGLEFQGVERAAREERAVQALTSVGLMKFAAAYPQQLSGGMRQRVALARALSLETDVLLMDEPFAALDEQTRMVFGEDLSRLLATQKKTIILVTHSLAEAVFLSDRIFVFTSRPGRIKAVLDVREAHPRHPRFMVSDRFGALRNQLYELLREEVLAAMGEDMPGLRP
jgi:NitT/TauT family transport system ATP-binding protein